MVSHWLSVCLSICWTSLHLYFCFRTITWVNVSWFSPNLVCALTLWRSGLRLLKGQFSPFLTIICLRYDNGEVLSFHILILQKVSFLCSCSLTLVLLNPDIHIFNAFANGVHPDQLPSEEVNWSGSALFVIQCVNLYQQPGSTNLNGWKLEVGMAS